ncbi:unnamed protein product, partial [Rotaria sordida]
MSYHASWIFRVLFTFLPINRISVLLTIPATPVTKKCSKYCGHGQCMSYMNDEKEFCLCNSGWFGDYCTTALNCNCSSDSLCLGIIHNRSICLCPLHKTGLRCLLPSTCQTARCADNKPICVPFDIGGQKSYTCQCEEKFVNDMCNNPKRFEVSFSKLPIPQVLLSHFIIADPD